MSGKESSPNEKLIKYLETYLRSTNHRGNVIDELETRFGTGKPITQIQFDSVISKLKSIGFSADNMSGSYRLTIQPEYTDAKTGYTKTSNIRTEISGLANIREYCKKNTFDVDKSHRLAKEVSFVQKNRKMVEDGPLNPIDFKDFGFRVNYKTESKRNPNSRTVEQMVANWGETKKIFRLIKRFTFKHNDYPLKIDCSIVRASKQKRRRLIPEYRIETSNVFHNPEIYEIEIELSKFNFPTSTGVNNTDPEFSDVNHVFKLLKRTIKIVLSGMQNSNYPISLKEHDGVLRNYMGLIYQGKPPDRRVHGKDFIGFSSISLEIPNITPINEESGVPNIRNPYTVTEKADGLRKLLYINKDGKVYLIDVNMNVQFTGVISKNQDYHDSLIDGEHVLHDKFGAFINYYLAFDAYYVGRGDIRSLPLANGGSDIIFKKTRVVELHDIVTKANFQPFLGNQLSLTIKEKTFYVSNSDTIFKNCNTILKNEADGLFEYETDGMIFTPADKGIGSDTIGETLPPKRITWKIGRAHV